jgi:hypothetical protein
MTRTRALVAILSAGLLFETVSILGMAALGVTGGVLSLGAIVPLVLVSFSSSLVIMHFGPYGGRDDDKRSDRR